MSFFKRKLSRTLLSLLLLTPVCSTTAVENIVDGKFYNYRRNHNKSFDFFEGKNSINKNFFKNWKNLYDDEAFVTDGSDITDDENEEPYESKIQQIINDIKTNRLHYYFKHPLADDAIKAILSNKTCTYRKGGHCAEAALTVDNEKYNRDDKAEKLEDKYHLESLYDALDINDRIDTTIIDFLNSNKVSKKTKRAYAEFGASVAPGIIGNNRFYSFDNELVNDCLPCIFNINIQSDDKMKKITSKNYKELFSHFSEEELSNAEFVSLLMKCDDMGLDKCYAEFVQYLKKCDESWFRETNKIIDRYFTFYLQICRFENLKVKKLFDKNTPNNNLIVNIAILKSLAEKFVKDHEESKEIKTRPDKKERSKNRNQKKYGDNNPMSGDDAVRMFFNK